jgi:hypothetical protein
LRILAASDIHIGRIPSLPGRAVQSAQQGARAAWDAVVQCALDQNCDALLLAGDVVQGDLAWFEARGPLLQGLKRLEDRGVKVIAVAGNHDALVFPDLARECPGLTMLGLHGAWNHVDLGPLRILGWSFPGPAFDGNPLATFHEGLAEGRPYLGLLHCDLDAPVGTRYAPVASRALEGTQAMGWVLGHIHKGEARAGGRAWYCGSPFALDAGEEGDHGAWLLEVDGHGTLLGRERVLLSPWAFRTLTVDLEGATAEEEARTRIAQALDRAAADGAAQGADTLFCSLRFTGSTALSGALDGLFGEGLAALETTQGAVTARLTGRVLDATDPALDLVALKEKRGIKGSLARLLLQARDPQGPLDEIPEVLARVMQLQPGAAADPAQARATLSLAARKLLLALDRQERGA